ncbi:S-layer homology domain-containing protein [Paenibacillus koleovorans]|uniref:S-layer homology domain-containing protein n=1 Tax=Paenibacillus koleovorans TaxID=121608 RepID=UPI0013E31A20|nr:S-layer homology domain-containing protein [Paenibacillus koleovorans]
MRTNRFIYLMTLIIGLIINLVLIAPIEAATKTEMDAVQEETAHYLLEQVSHPEVGSVGGEWAVLGLARSNQAVPQSYFDEYYETVKKYVVDLNGELHDKKYTEYSRLILALTAIGANPADVGGYNLLLPLGDFEKTIWQGINGPIFALIAMDSGSYEIPRNTAAKVQATRELYIDEILSRQLKDGGFALSGDQADPDITGMALQALSNYQNRKHVKTASDRALEVLSKLQNTDGGYSTWGVPTSESSVQVLMALCELGISVTDSRFVKNGHTIVDNLLAFYEKGHGFQHTADGGGVTGMSTEQAFYGLVNAVGIAEGKRSLYRMTDVKWKTPSTRNEALGLPNKHADVRKLPVLEAMKTFIDIFGHPNQTAIEDLASRGIINGLTTEEFAPNQTMTRAEFAAIVTRGLGLPLKPASVFKDVPADSWYSSYIGSAHHYGIVNGTSDTTFAPAKTITKQEAAVMIANAAKLCGFDTAMSKSETRDMLAQFGDYVQSAEWARDALAFNYREHILSQDAMDIEPQVAVKRGEMAEMLHRLLTTANLL